MGLRLLLLTSMSRRSRLGLDAHHLPGAGLAGSADRHVQRPIRPDSHASGQNQPITRNDRARAVGSHADQRPGRIARQQRVGMRTILYYKSDRLYLRTSYEFLLNENEYHIPPGYTQSLRRLISSRRSVRISSGVGRPRYHQPL